MDMRTHKTSVLVVDDSALIRKLLKEILSSDPDLEVVGAAHDPLHARELIKQHNPDVLTLDVEMPKMDGITFLTNLMRLRPMPVVMVSSLTEQGADVTLQALEIGAFDFVTKPKIDVSHQLQHYTEEIVAKVKAAAKSRVRPYDPSRPRASAASRWPSNWPRSPSARLRRRPKTWRSCKRRFGSRRPRSTTFAKCSTTNWPSARPKSQRRTL